MVFGVEDVVFEFAHLEHLAQQFRNFHRCCANQNRAACVVEPLDFVDDSLVFFAYCLIYEVFLVVADYGTVCGDDAYVEFVYFPKFASLRLRRTGHAREFFIHAEVVLECDCGESLGCCLHFDAFLGFNRLVETVGIAATFEDTSCAFFHDFHLVVHYDIFNVALKHRVGFEELVDGVDAFGFCGKVAHNLVASLHLFFLAEVRMFEFRNFAADVRHHEKLRVVGVVGDEVDAFFCEVY